MGSVDEIGSRLERAGRVSYGYEDRGGWEENVNGIGILRGWDCLRMGWDSLDSEIEGRRTVWCRSRRSLV